MMNMVDLDPSYSVPCMHCAALLKRGVRICPFCGKDQSTVIDVPEAKPPPEPIPEPGRAPARGRATPTPMVVDFADTVQPEDNESLGYPIPTTAAANDEADPEIGLVRPGAFWKKEVLVDGKGPKHWAGSSILPVRLVVSVVAALGLLGIALLVDNLYLDNESEAGRQREFKSNVEQVQSALKRGDLGVAARVLEGLETDHDDDPTVQALRDTVDQRLQEQVVKREQLREAQQKASKAIGLPEPVAPAPPPVPAQVQVKSQRRDSAQDAVTALGLSAPAAAPKPSPTPAPESTPQSAPVSAPVAARSAAPAAPEPKAAAPAPAQAKSVADSKEKECNQMLAALALCQK